MFILYARPHRRSLVGLLVGGRPAGLADLHFRWSWLVFGGLLVQVVLFSEPVSERIGDLGPPIYVVSTAAVSPASSPTRAIPGLPIVALGRRQQPGRDRRQRRLHAGRARRRWPRWRQAARGLLEQRRRPRPGPRPLTDIFALPAWLPVRQHLQHRRRPDRDRRARRHRGAMRIRPARHVRRQRARRRSAPEPGPLPVDNSHERQAPLVLLGHQHAEGMRDSTGIGTSVPRLLGRPGQTRREAGTQSQGSRKRPPGRRSRSDQLFVRRGSIVKAKLARFTWAVTVLASLALSVGAGMRWDWW